MMDRDRVFTVVPGLRAQDLDLWIARAWVKPQADEPVVFADIDVARIRLLVLLQVDLEIDPEAVPVVLSLLDQLHDARRQLRVVRRAIDEAASTDLRTAIADRMRLLAND